MQTSLPIGQTVFSHFTTPQARGLLFALAACGLSQVQRKAVTRAILGQHHVNTNGIKVTVQRSFRTAVYIVNPSFFLATYA